ncbi:MAG: polyprenyl synthetase family protein [Actinomycetota bacterium]
MIDSLAFLAGRVEAALAQFLKERSAALAEIGSDLDPMAEAACRFILDGGKRLRPMFAYWAWRACAPAADDDASILWAASSLELLHGCALVHDDVMDDSATRRGQPSAHAAFAGMHAENGYRGDPRVFGTAAAILLGDLLLSWSDSMFAAAGFDPHAARRTRQVYDEMRQLVMAGQYLDVLVQARGNFDVGDALRVITYKTSKYTVEGPLLLGAAAADASAELTAALSACGLSLGEAFQLRDDVLGVYGDSSRTGKPAGDDLREGKRTVLMALAMQHADPAQAATLRGELGNDDLDQNRIDAVRQIIVDTGALDQVEQRIALRTDDALAALKVPGMAPEARVVLERLALAATQRQT